MRISGKTGGPQNPDYKGIKNARIKLSDLLYWKPDINKTMIMNQD